MAGAEIVRPSRHAVRDWLMATLFDPLAWFARTFAPVCRFGGQTLVFRYDDVREILERDRDFGVPYGDALRLILDGAPFILSMSDDEAFHAAEAMMHRVVGQDVKQRLAARVTAAARLGLERAGGRIDVIEWSRTIAEQVFCEDFGTPSTAGAPMAEWMQRLFEFIFLGDDEGRDTQLIDSVNRIVPALRAYIDNLIRERKAGLQDNASPIDDVLGRALAEQRASRTNRPSDVDIRTLLIGLLIAGLPQMPMAVPQALQQLLRRGDVMKRVKGVTGDGLFRFIREALRLDPLLMFMQRVPAGAAWIAETTPHPRRIDDKQLVAVSPRSAMFDDRRIPSPRVFDETRDDSNYAHFGHGLHYCFGQQMVEGMLPAFIAPLLDLKDVRQTTRLIKRGIFASSMEIAWNAVSPRP